MDSKQVCLLLSTAMFLSFGHSVYTHESSAKPTTPVLTDKVNGMAWPLALERSISSVSSVAANRRSS